MINLISFLMAPHPPRLREYMKPTWPHFAASSQRAVTRTPIKLLTLLLGARTR
jgi:hypothetical protein